jgi:transcriptional regulator with GAF, ATPase, and Fis domain
VGADFFEQRLRILSGALREFAEATEDYDRLVGVVALTLAEVIGDGCVVRILGDDGWLRPVAIHVPSPAFEQVKDHIAAPHRADEHAGARQLMETGDAMLVPTIDLAQMRTQMSAEMADVYEALGLHSLLLVGLRVRGASIGTLSLFRFRAGTAAYDTHDRHLAQALADHAAMAITNARLVKRLEGELETLRGLIPICAWCKQVQDDRGSWAQIEAYVSAHTDMKFTHGICPSCAVGLKKS